MESEKTVLKIEDFEKKETKAGKSYMRFKTSKGWMSCFDKKSCEALKEMKGSEVNCEIAKSGEFMNIKKYLGSNEEKTEVLQETKVNENIASGKFPTSMKVAYAKDCFCAMVTRISQSKFDNFEKEDIEELMKTSINVVNKAINEFL